jgi:hypothetical protein
MPAMPALLLERTNLIWIQVIGEPDLSYFKFYSKHILEVSVE